MKARILERGKTSGRADDNAEAIRKRLCTFKEDAIEAFQGFFIMPGLSSELSEP